MVVTNIFFGGGETNEPIHLDEVRCTGTETSLLNCTHNGIGSHDCLHFDDVGIICRPSQGTVMTRVFNNIMCLSATCHDYKTALMVP